MQVRSGQVRTGPDRTRLDTLLLPLATLNQSHPSFSVVQLLKQFSIVT
ncbi:hypothetical protein FHW77_004771 [Agrobacterium sp. RC10-4-1]|nr:hypothetical protein [Agrobacterium sp. RC10-4-1]